MCVKWGSTNTSWHINVHHMKNLHTHEVIKCEVKDKGMGMGHLWLNESGIYHFMGEAFIT